MFLNVLVLNLQWVYFVKKKKDHESYDYNDQHLSLCVSHRWSMCSQLPVRVGGRRLWVSLIHQKHCITLWAARVSVDGTEGQRKIPVPAVPGRCAGQRFVPLRKKGQVKRGQQFASKAKHQLQKQRPEM